MKTNKSIAIMVLVGALQFTAAAAPKELPLRSSPGMPIYQGLTTRTIATQYGSKISVLPFSGTTTYDFFSSPLVSDCSLSEHDKCGGRMYVRNRAGSHTNDFTVTGKMQFFDYDPNTGTQNLIVDTGASNAKQVRSGKTVNLSLPSVALGSDRTIPSGHLLHVAVTVAVVSGDATGLGSLLYDGPRSRSSAAILSDDTNLSLNFTGSASPGQSTNSIQMLPNGTAQITCSGAPNQSYAIEATTDLASPSWTTIATNTTGANGLCVFIDNDAPHFPARFYRTLSR